MATATETHKTMSQLLELANAQQKLQAIDSLTNVIHKVSANEAKEVAYLIHRIVEADSLNSDLARSITHWKLQANKDLFITA